MRTAPHLHPHLPSFLAWPRTRAGTAAAWLGLLCVVLVIAHLMTPADDSRIDVKQLEVVLMILTAPAALIAAVIAGFRDRERSVFVWIPIAVGALMLAFTFVELTFPRA